MVHTKRKRKVAIRKIDEEKENESETTSAVNEPAYNNGPMYKIMSHIQTSEALHKKYIKELQQLYAKMDHDAFLFTFIRMIKTAMACDEANEYAMTSLQFCAKFITSFEGEETHPVLNGIFDWLLSTISNNPHIRFRLCEFINMVLTALGAEAALEDAICDKILEYMVDRLLDMAPNVRVQAIVAMTRLQVPDNPDDPVVRAYQFHLCSDPSPRVRIAVIKCMGRNYITIPYILDRLRDIDEKVRRQTYLNISSYPVRSYKVSQRLMLLEQGLNDRSESVRKIVSKFLLQQWFESYQKNLIQLVTALKLDATEEDIEQFHRVTKQALPEIFSREDPKFLIEFLPVDPESEFRRCISHEKLSMEVALYWQCLSEFLQTQMADEFDLILPELSIFCAYVEKFCEIQKPDMDKFENMEFNYKLLSLLQILYKYDLGDEIGRGNLRKLLDFLLRKVNLEEKNIEIIIRCAENVITDQKERMEFLMDVITDICDLNSTQNNFLQDCRLNDAILNCTDSALKMKLAGLKMKIMELAEEEDKFLHAKNFVNAQKVTDEKSVVTEEYWKLLKPLLDQPTELRKVKIENIVTGLQIIFHMVVSEKVSNLSPQVIKLYNQFICRHLASATTVIRDWALKCGTAYSMHYEPIAKEVVNELYQQFFKHHIQRIWKTSVKCIFEILDLYGIDNFSPHDQRNSTSLSTTTTNTTARRAGRQLYNTLENLDIDDETQDSGDDQSVGLIQIMSHFLGSCENELIASEVVLGFIRLIVHGHLNNSEIIEKLLIRYFNPATDTKINQYLGIFLEEMIRLRKQKFLLPSLIPTINAVLSAPYDSPLLEIRLETITRFFIDITRQDTTSGRQNNLHNSIAEAFLNEMLNNVNNKELLKLLSKEILKLELNVANNSSLKENMKEMAEKLLASELDPKTHKNLSDFKDMLNGIFTRAINGENESEEEADDDTVTNENQPRTSNTTPANDTVGGTTPTVSTINEESDSTLTECRVGSVNIENVETAPTTTTTTEKDNSEPAISADEATIHSASVITSSQTSTEASISAPASTTTTTETTTVVKQKTPTITTFGRQNQVGLRCLRRSLNNSQTHSESESDATPKIRIELRIDSEKKSKTAEKTVAEMKKRTKAITATTAAAKVINSVSSRSLRMLSRHQRAESPLASKAKDKDKTTTAATAAGTTTTTTNTTASELSSSEELNNSEIITKSPNVTTRVLASSRLRGGANTTETAASTNTKQTRSTRNQILQSQSNPPRQSPHKTPTSSPKTGKTASNTSPQNKTPTSLSKSPEQMNKTPTPKTPEQFNKTQTPKSKTPISKSKTPVQVNKTPSPKTKTPQSKSKTPSPKTKTPSDRSTAISIIIATPNSPNKTSVQTSTKSPNATQNKNSSSATAKSSVSLPRKSIYATTATLQRSSARKRVLPRTPHPRKSQTMESHNKSDSSSSTSKSPEPKQLRRSLTSPKTQTPRQQQQQQKRLTAKDIEQLLDETSDSNSDTSTTRAPKTPIKQQPKKQAATTTKKSNKKTTKTNDANRRKSTIATALLFNSAESIPSRALSTRNATRTAYRLKNVMTRKRMHEGSTSDGLSSTSSSAVTSPQLVRKTRAAPSRIPVKFKGGGTTSTTSSRSSSVSPKRKNNLNTATTSVDNFKKPVLRTRSLERVRSSRIPRKLT